MCRRTAAGGTFPVGGRDRWALLAHGLGICGADEIARIRFDLAVVERASRCRRRRCLALCEPATGAVLARSEGLAVASFDLFGAGTCSADPRAAAARRRRGAGGDRSRRPGARLPGAATTIRWPGSTVAPSCCAGSARRIRGQADVRRAGAAIGNLFDHLAGQAQDGLPAPAILAAVLEGLAEIWPGRIALAGVNLGDVGRHPAAGGDDLTAGLVPFHKLSQWLAYSLIEPLEDAGIKVVELDQLTALAEYRNGGLLIDLGVLRPKHAGVLGEAACRQLRGRGRVARADGRADRPAGASASGRSSACRPRSCRCQGPGGRHLGGRPPDRRRAAPRRRPAAAA